MKLDKKLIDYIENSDAYYIVAVKDGKNITSCQSKDNDVLTASHLIAGALLGGIKSAIEDKELVNNVPILVTIAEAIKRFPQLLKIK